VVRFGLKAMLIKTVELVNFCQFRNQTFHFGSGLNVIVGNNGVGKSNLMHAVAGDFSLSGTVKTDNVCWYADKSEPAYVKLVLENKPGEDIIIFRSLARASSFVKAGISILASGKESDVQQTIENLFRLSAKEILRYLFVRQWEMFDFLVATSAESALYWQDLFNLEKLRRIHDAVRNVSLPDVDKSPIDRRSIEERLEKVRKEIEEIRSSFPGIDSWDPDSDEDYLLVKKRSSYDNLIVEYRQKLTNYKSLSRRYCYICRSLTDINRLQQSVQSLEKTYNAKQIELNNIETYRRNHERYLSLQKQLRELNLQLARAVYPEQPSIVNYLLPDGTSPEQITESQAAALQTRLKHLEAVTSKFVKPSPCPVCDTPWEQLADRIDDYRKQLPAIRAVLAKYDAWQKAKKEYEEACRQIDALRANLSRKIEEVSTTLIDLEPYKDSPPNDTALRKELADLSNQLSSLRQKLIEQAVFLREKKTLKETLLNEVQAIRLLRQKIAANFVSDEDLQKAKSNIERKKASYSKLHELRGKERELTSLLEDHLSEEKLATIKHKRKVRDELLMLFSRNELPAKYLSIAWKKLETIVNNYLNDLNYEYSIAFGEDNSIYVRNKQGKLLSIRRLSGGQKMLFGFLIRLAVARLCCSNFPFLWLDEPTAGMDDIHMDQLQDICSVIKSGILNKVQIFLITHSKEFVSIADQVIAVTGQ
jgi:DNA repair exonuclease SbcCD ATPase subunit